VIERRWCNDLRCRPGQAKRRSGIHNHGETFGEDSESPDLGGSYSLWLWIPAFAGMTAENEATAPFTHPLPHL